MLVAFWQVQRLTREINTLEKKAMDKQIELSNYQKYASVLGGSSILNLGNIAWLSSKLLPRASVFAQYSNQTSSMMAMQNLQYAKMMGQVPYTGNMITQQQLEMSAFARFKEEALKAIKQEETQILNEKEKEIQLELNSIEQQLTMKRKKLESYKQLAKDGAQNMTPTFGM